MASEVFFVFGGKPVKQFKPFKPLERFKQFGRVKQFNKGGAYDSRLL